MKTSKAPLTGPKALKINKPSGSFKRGNTVNKHTMVPD